MRAYGETPQVPDGSAVDPLALAQQYAPVIQSLVLPTDAVERSAVIEARIANLKAMKRQFPVLGQLYDNEIRKLKARLAGSQRATMLQTEQERSRRVFRYLGWGAAGVGILVGVAVIARLVRRN